MHLNLQSYRKRLMKFRRINSQQDSLRRGQRQVQQVKLRMGLQIEDKQFQQMINDSGVRDTHQLFPCTSEFWLRYFSIAIIRSGITKSSWILSKDLCAIRKGWTKRSKQPNLYEGFSPSSIRSTTASRPSNAPE